MSARLRDITEVLEDIAGSLRWMCRAQWPTARCPDCHGTGFQPPRNEITEPCGCDGGYIHYNLDYSLDYGPLKREAKQC